MTAKQFFINMKIDKSIFAVTIIAVILSLVVVSKTLTPYMAMATLSYSLLTMGLVFRRQRTLHYRLMGSGIILDLLIVLTLEMTRHAVETAVALKLPPLQQAHIFSSAIAVLMYIPTVTIAVLRLNGNSSLKLRSNHMIFGITAFIFRTIGFILMFSLIKKG